MQILRNFIPFSISTRRFQPTFAIFIDPDALGAEICNFKDLLFFNKTEYAIKYTDYKIQYLRPGGKFCEVLGHFRYLHDVFNQLLPFSSIQRP